MMKNRDIIVVGLQAYDNAIGSNCINIANEFAKNNRVLYVNYAFDRASIKREKDLVHVAKRIRMMKNNEENLIQINEHLWNLYPDTLLESINWIPFTSIFRIFNHINNKRFATEIKKAIDRLNFKDFIIFNDSDMFRSNELKELLEPACYVYYTRDNMMSVPYWYKHGHQLEAELMAKSDLVCANSAYLAELAAPYNKHHYDVGQGCDVTEFDLEKVTQLPADIESISKPIIGYIGALYTLRLDIDIIRKIAAYNAEWQVVLIGPEDENFKKSDLHNLPNVHFLGLKKQDELPAYLKAFDVAINPQILNEVTIGNYPRKVDEYLAMGKPVVATATKAMEMFKDHTYLAASADAYPALIEKALEEDSLSLSTQRITFARSHTWENSVLNIYRAIEKVKPELMK